MRNIPFSLTHRVIVAFLAILLPLCAVFYINYQSNKERIKSLVLDNLETLAEEREKTLSLFIEKNRERIKDFSTDGIICAGVENSRGAFSKELGEYLKKNKVPLEPEMNEIALFSPKGRLVASSNGRLTAKSVTGEDFFIRGLRSNAVSENAAKFSVPGLVFSSPVMSMDGKKTVGVIAGFLPASLLNSVMQGLRTSGYNELLWVNRWDTIETYIVNRDGTMITGSRFIKDAPFRTKVPTYPVDECNQKAKAVKGFYPDYRGVSVAGASMCVSEFKWTLLAEIDEFEALKDLREARLYSTGAFLAAFSLVAFLVLYFLRHIVKPLEGFSATAKRIAEGDYDISVPVRSKDEIGALSESFNAMSRSIKERKEALALSTERLANAQRIAHIGNWDWDMVRNELRWSDEIYRIFGMEQTEFGATYDAFQAAVHPEDRDLVNEAVNDALSLGGSYSIDHRIVLPSGEIRIVHEQAEVIRNAWGKPVTMSGTVQDITERKTAENEVKKLNAELEDKVRERTAELEAAIKGLESFSYSVAHDLRAPLRTIDGFSQALTEDFGDKVGPQGHDYLKRIREGSQRMGHLIDDLLTLSYVTRTEMKREEVDLSHLAEAAAAEQKKTVTGREVKCIISPRLKATGDPGLLRIVLVNLIGNAFKFTAKKTASIIEFSATGKEGQHTVYCVRDNGVGFDMRYYGKLFIPFQRLHSNADFQGTGIGLATVERIIWRHGGRVWAEGEAGKGAAFYFTL